MHTSFTPFPAINGLFQNVSFAVGVHAKGPEQKDYLQVVLVLNISRAYVH